MRQSFLYAALLASLIVCRAAVADVKIYNHTVKFAPSTPASITARAYEPIDFTVVGQRQVLSALIVPPPLDPNIRFIQQPTQFIVAEYLNQGMISTAANASPQTTSSLRLPGLLAGKYKIRLMYPKGEVFDEREIIVNDYGTPVVVQTIGLDGPNAFLLSWFATKPSPSGVASTSTPYPGVSAGKPFGAWLSEERAPSGTVPLFYLSVTIDGSVLNFYTANPDYRAALKAAGWQDNGALVNVLRYDGSACPAGSEPVYQAFRAAKPGMWGATHRYTSDVSVYADSIASGHWRGEGVAFCGRVITEAIVETAAF